MKTALKSNPIFFIVPIGFMHYKMHRGILQLALLNSSSFLSHLKASLEIIFFIMLLLLELKRFIFFYIKLYHLFLLVHCSLFPLHKYFANSFIDQLDAAGIGLSSTFSAICRIRF